MSLDASTRQDANVASHLLLEMAQERSLDLLLNKLVHRAIERPDLACLQIWLIDRGDRCADCPSQAFCGDRANCLHLVAGAGKAVDGKPSQASYFGGLQQRNPLAHGVLGRVVESGHQTYIQDVAIDSGLLRDLSWLEQEHVASCGCIPIQFQGKILGAMRGFSRDTIDETPVWGQIFADHIGAAIANARAFAEIERLKAQLEQQNTYLKEEVSEAKAFGVLVGQSSALRQVISQVDLVAPTEASVLILGETGTGKDLVAHEIHRRSLRKDMPMVRVNCASVPKELFESEFFGHIKGAFTGATKDRPGRFETAEGGTLFLDEIGELPLEMQSKLLRVLQEKCYERVGDDRTRRADARIICATNRDLKAEVAAGRFREDLYYRLHVFPIYVTTLKERMDDLPLLAKHFVELSVKELRCAKPRLTRAALVSLQNYDWPGNVRELRNVVERAVILARGGPLHFDLPTALSTAPALPSLAPLAADDAPPFYTEAEMQRRDRDNLVAVLAHAQWKIKGPNGAAELLGVKPTTLLSRMKKLGLQRPAK